MSSIPLDTYKEHLRVVGTIEDLTIQLYANAAEQRVEQHLNRTLFVDEAEQTAVLATLPAKLADIETAFDAALTAADLIEDVALRCAARDRAIQIRQRARSAVQEAYDGLVLNDAVRAACLLWTGTLYANREGNVGTDAGSQLPNGIWQLLAPYRVGLGV